MSSATTTSDAAWFSGAERAGLRDYWRVYDRFYPALQAESVQRLRAHPRFGPIVAQMPPDLLAEQQAASHSRLRRAIEEGEWKEYAQVLRGQGVAYARLGVEFREWYDLVRMVSQQLTPRLISAYAEDADRLCNALLAMNEVLDRSMAWIGEAYLDEKEGALRTSERRLAATLESLHDGLVIAAPDGAIVYRNSGSAKIASVEPALSQVGGAPSAVMISLADGETAMEPVDYPIARALRGERVNDLELCVVPAGAVDGVYLSVNAAPIGVDGGEPLGAVVSYRDVSHRRQMEAQRAVAAEIELRRRHVQEANRLKSEFLANMSHELRTALTSILGFGELLYDGEVGPVSITQREFLADIVTSGRHLLRLVNDVLDLAMVEAGKMEFHPEAIELERLVAEVVSILRTTSAEHAITIESQIDPSLGEVVLDPSRLKQVLYNFLSSALKLTPTGGRVAVRARPEGDQWLRLAVENTDVGIAPDEIERLVGEFQQLHGGHPKTHNGAGLGLALTRRLVEAQGGAVGVEGRLGEGASFFAVLPRRGGSPGSVRTHAIFADSVHADAPTVLVVEHDSRDPRRIVETLTGAGYHVEAASTGARALARCAEKGFDAIVVDLAMPGLDGFAFLERLRALPQRRSLPVFVWAVKDLSPDELRRLVASAQVVIQQGGTTAQLVAELGVYLQPRPSSAVGFVS